MVLGWEDETSVIVPAMSVQATPIHGVPYLVPVL